MSKNPLDLNRLTMDDIDFSGVKEDLEKDKQQQKEYQEKYGDDWWEHWLADTIPNYGTDRDERTINEAIYNGHRLCICAHPVRIAEFEKKYQEKMKRLFGPFYKKYISHEPNNSKVNKALLKDALKSGKWRELPEELQEEYHRLAGE